MSISGKMSVGVILMDVMPSNKMSSAITTNVYGRRRANLTIHISRRERIAVLLYLNIQTGRYGIIHKKESLRFQTVQIIEKSMARLQQYLLVLSVFGRTGHARLHRDDERRHFPRRNVFSHFACLDPAGERGCHGLSPRDIDLLERLAEFFVKG